MSDDFVVNVRQIQQYARATAAQPSDGFLLQRGGVGGPYAFMAPQDLLSSTLEQLPIIRLAAGTSIAWNGVTLASDGTQFTLSAALNVPNLNISGMGTLGGQEIATTLFVGEIYDTLVADIANVVANSVTSFNGRTGGIILTDTDILRAGGILQNSPHLHGIPTAPIDWDTRRDDDRIATAKWVQDTICSWLMNSPLFMGRPGPGVLKTADVNAAYFTIDEDVPQAPTPPPYDATNRIATTGWVSDEVGKATTTIIIQMDENTQAVLDYLNLHYAPLSSPVFSGYPTAPTPPLASNDGSIATTSWVLQKVSDVTAGVVSFNGRSGVVDLTTQDVIDAGAAPLDTPAFSGQPTAPTPPVGTSSNRIATCDWVLQEVAAISSGVTTFNGRSGAVSLQLSDVTGVGGAPIASPNFSGTPSAPTAIANTATTQLATTAFVQAALAAAPGGVSSFNSRTGAITLNSSDISAAGGALLAGPAFTGNPTATTQATTANNTTIATTAFVKAAIAAAGGVSTFNGRAGAITLGVADIVGASGAAYLQQDAAPAVGANNTFWFDSSNGQLYVQYRDPVSSAQSWVIANSPQPQPVLYAVNSYLTAVSTTFTTPANATTATVYRVRMVGGGGGGGGAGAGTNTPGAGGGGGEFKELIVTGRPASDPWTVVTGVGGAGGDQSLTDPNGNGVAGGNTTLTIGGQAIACNGGGGGGRGYSAVTSSAGGTGGAGGATGALAGLTLVRSVAGQAGFGSQNTTTYITVGPAGSSEMGLGGMVRNLATGAGQHTPGTGNGAGGAGAYNSNYNGAAGSPGAIIIERIAG